MSEYHTKRAAEILREIRYATIATVTDEGSTWNSPVAYEVDNNLVIYWASDKETSTRRTLGRTDKRLL